MKKRSFNLSCVFNLLMFPQCPASGKGPRAVGEKLVLPVPSSGIATIIFLFIPLLSCIICVCPCHRPLGLLLSKVTLGSLTCGNDLSAYCAYGGETGTDESAQVLTRKTWKTVLHPVSTGLEPTVAAFTASPAQLASHWATVPVAWYLTTLTSDRNAGHLVSTHEWKAPSQFKTYKALNVWGGLEKMKMNEPGRQKIERQNSWL